MFDLDIIHPHFLLCEKSLLNLSGIDTCFRMKNTSYVQIKLSNKLVKGLGKHYALFRDQIFCILFVGYGLCICYC